MVARITAGTEVVGIVAENINSADKLVISSDFYTDQIKFNFEKLFGIQD